MDNSKVQQLKRGTLDMVLLALIYKHDYSYGYAILNALDEMGGEFFRNSKPGTVYPALYRLEAENLITVDEEKETGSQRRKYKITTQGIVALEDMIQTWHEYVATVNGIL